MPRNFNPDVFPYDLMLKDRLSILINASLGKHFHQISFDLEDGRYPSNPMLYDSYAEKPVSPFIPKNKKAAFVVYPSSHFFDETTIMKVSNVLPGRNLDPLESLSLVMPKKPSPESLFLSEGNGQEADARILSQAKANRHFHVIRFNQDGRGRGVYAGESGVGFSSSSESRAEIVAQSRNVQELKSPSVGGFCYVYSSRDLLPEMDFSVDKKKTPSFNS